MDFAFEVKIGISAPNCYKPYKNRFPDVDALPNHTLITNADMNLFQRLTNSPQSKLLNEYGVAYDNISNPSP